MQQKAIFPVFYLPPISYLHAYFALGEAVLFEQYENFPKQTYRNRASILSPNGQLDLIVPVTRGTKRNDGAPGHTRYKDTRISNEFNWQRLHWRSLESCYRSAAYFEYYEDELREFYNRPYNFLLDLNLDLFGWLMEKLKKPVTIELTTEYHDIAAENDFRARFNKNKTSYPYIAKPYFQVFDDREGFQQDLSIADLLFNQGPQAKNYI